MKMALGIAIMALGLACKLAPSSSSDDPDTLAKVNGQSIRSQQFESELNRLAQTRSSRHFNEDEKQSLLLEMINFELIYQQAQKENFIDKNSKVRKAVVEEYLRETINQKYNPTDAAAEAFYKTNRHKIDSVCISHILISSRNRTDEQAKSRAKMVLNRLRHNEDFSILAGQFSDDQSNKEMGGGLGCITQETEFVPEFKQAAFALKKVGDLSDLVKTIYGYHIILLETAKRDLAANRDDIKAVMANQIRQKVFADLTLKLKEKAEIQLHFDKLENINLTTVDKP